MMCGSVLSGLASFTLVSHLLSMVKEVMEYEEN